MKFRGEYYFLSNFHPAVITFEGREYATSEHAYQAAKSTDDRERARIAGKETPGLAKRAGRTILMREDWEEVKLGKMEQILRLKFAIPHLRKLLVATYPEKLVEDNTWGDKFWGVYEGRGENHLGKILMKIRAELL